MSRLLNWFLWCKKLKKILPIEVGMVSHRNLTKEEIEYPLTSGMWRKYLRDKQQEVNNGY